MDGKVIHEIFTGEVEKYRRKANAFLSETDRIRKVVRNVKRPQNP
jgi:hypothetical protein